MNDADQDSIAEQLREVRDFLKENSFFPDDALLWSANCLTAFLDGKAKSLDHAFGIRTSKRGPKPMDEGKHDDWVVAAWWKVKEATPMGSEWPNTKALAGIGRYFGLGGSDSKNAEDHAVASELKRILIRYRGFITKSVSAEIGARLRTE